jgi:uncharacterized repeat protein (TIGR03803 family)
MLRFKALFLMGAAFVLVAFAKPAPAASQEKVLKYFGGRIHGKPNGFNPSGGLVFDDAGNLYGTTQDGGYPCSEQVGCGVVFELSPSGGRQLG